MVGAQDTSLGVDFRALTDLIAIPAEARAKESGVPVARERLGLGPP